MGSRQAAHPSAKRLVLGLFAVVVFGACGSGGAATTAPTAAPTAPPSSAPTTAPSTAPSTVPSTSAAASAGDADAQIAALKAKLNGKKITIGTSSFPNSSITGAFKTVEYLRNDFGLDVDFKTVDSDPLVAAMISGQIQIGQLSLAGMASANSAGADFVAVGADDQKNTFVVAAKKAITDMAQFKGKPFAVTQNLSQITGQTARKCLATAGLDIEKDVQLLKLANTSETTKAIQTGQVAGAISATFRLTALKLAEGDDAYTILCKGWEVNPQISSIWMVDRKWLDQNSDVALALNIASIQSARWAHANKDEWVKFATANVNGLKADAAAKDYDTLIGELDNWPVNGSLDRALCDSTLKTSFEFKVTDKEYKTDDLVNFTFQDQALAILGKQ
jgi:ABC-type nitrate/sulfonate/bicarbonate transport system substrate-binding protein